MQASPVCIRKYVADIHMQEDINFAMGHLLCLTGCYRADLGRSLMDIASGMSEQAMQDLARAASILPAPSCPATDFGKPVD